MHRRLEKEKRYKNLQEKKKADEEMFQVINWNNVTLGETDKEHGKNISGVDNPDGDTEDADYTRSKRKRLSELSSSKEDPLPHEYRHIRHNVNVVKPVF